jgi:hypothetical protein
MVFALLLVVLALGEVSCVTHVSQWGLDVPNCGLSEETACKPVNSNMSPCSISVRGVVEIVSAPSELTAVGASVDAALFRQVLHDEIQVTAVVVSNLQLVNMSLACGDYVAASCTDFSLTNSSVERSWISSYSGNVELTGKQNLL